MGHAPSAFPPPVTNDEFITSPSLPEDEVLEVGVLIIGAGPAGLACAIRTAQYLAENEAQMEALGEVPIAVVDKGKVAGAHQLSGAVVNPIALRELVPDMSMEELGSYGEVTKESVYVMTKSSALRIPTPPPFHNKKNHVFSLSELTRKLADTAEELGVMILPETTADKLLVADNQVRGVLTGDKGRGKDGEKLANFEPGVELHAKTTVLTEGTQGHLTIAAVDHFGIASDNAQIWSLGVKEVWKVDKPLDRVIHTMGWPLKTGAKWNEMGGSWIYPMGDDHVSIGFVAGLDTTDPNFSVHDVFQEFKTHAKIRSILEGGERVWWGAKTIPEGGWYALPKQLSVPGLVMAGDGPGMVNVPKLKGVHYAMKAGMLAADSITEALGADALDSAERLSSYDEKVGASYIKDDLYKSRNMRQVFEKGFFVGGALAAMMDATRGAFPGGKWRTVPDATHELEQPSRTYPEPDGALTFDKLSSVFLSGNKTRDDQPNHIRLETDVPKDVAQTWVSLCPAAVYEIAGEPDQDGNVSVEINPSNCVHCGAITAKGGKFTPPEGGSGPEYTKM